MVIKEYGDKNFPKIIILHPMLADGFTCMKLLKDLGNKYSYIVPDFSSHGESEGEFISALKEADILMRYLKENDYKEIELIFGASMGAVVALYTIAYDSIKFKTIVLDGAPMYRNSYVLYNLLKFIMISKQKKAKKNPEGVIQEMKKIYGELGESMAKSLVKIKRESMNNVLWSCTHFKFPDYPRELQKRIFFEFGDKDFYSKRVRLIQKKYPYVHINIRNDYGHCEFLAISPNEYVKMLIKYIEVEYK